jgi:hypothetical protein
LGLDQGCNSNKVNSSLLRAMARDRQKCSASLLLHSTFFLSGKCFLLDSAPASGPFRLGYFDHRQVGQVVGLRHSI